MPRVLDFLDKPHEQFELDAESEQAVGLVGWWPGWSPGTNQLFDRSGRGNHGTLTSFADPYSTTSGWAPGVDGGRGALVFDDSDDYVLLPVGVTAPLANKTASWAAWFRPTVTLTGYETIVELASGAAGRNVGIFPSAATSLYVAFANSGGVVASISESWVLNVWQHACVTCDGTTIRIYRNGHQVGTTTSASAIGSGFITTTGARIGKNFISGGSQYGGSIEDSRLYNVAVSPEVVAKMYDQSTRWQLRWQPGRRLISVPSVVSTGNRRRRTVICMGSN